MTHKQTSLALAALALGLAPFALGCEDGAPSPSPAASAEPLTAPKPMDVVPASPPKVDLGPLPVPAMSAADLPPDPAASTAPKPTGTTTAAAQAPAATTPTGVAKDPTAPADLRATPRKSPGPMAPRTAPTE